MARSWQSIAAQLPDTSLLVVGKGLFGEDEDFLRLARANGAGGHMVAPGWVDVAALNRWLAADLALFPFDDTLLNQTKSPVKLADLLAAGLPVVAERVGQVAEYVEHARSGWLVEPSSGGKALAAAAVRLLEDERLRGQLAQGAERVETQFAWDSLARRLEEVYRR